MLFYFYFLFLIPVKKNMFSDIGHGFGYSCRTVHPLSISNSSNNTYSTFFCQFICVLTSPMKKCFCSNFFSKLVFNPNKLFFSSVNHVPKWLFQKNEINLAIGNCYLFNYRVRENREKASTREIWCRSCTRSTSI